MPDKPLAIIGGRVIDPSAHIDRPATVLVRDGNIQDITATPTHRAPEGYDTLDATGLVVSPGFIDIHCHLRDPGFEHKETLTTGSAAARGGFTTVCAMPNTDPTLDTASVVATLVAGASREAQVRVLPIAAITTGRNGKELAPMAELIDAGAVAFSDDGDPVMDANIMRQALAYCSRLGRKGTGVAVINHAEDRALSRDGQVNDGPAATRLGLAGIPVEAEAAMVARDIHLAELTGGRLHIPHVSTARAVEHLRAAKSRGLRVTAEATPHHLTMTDSWVYGLHGQVPVSLSHAAYDTNTKVSPPLRSRADIEAVVAALAEGVIGAVATDHAPHAQTDKVCTFHEAAKGINCLETAFGQVMALVHAGALGLPALIERLTSGPARVLGLDGGTLRNGSPADITIFDPLRVWKVDPNTFASKSHNSPLGGVELKGCVVATLVGGKVVYDARAK